MAACEGALLIVDATQGVEAQTLANLFLALEADLVIVPVINKIDLISARPDEIAEDISNLFGGNPEDIIRVSAKEGTNIDQVLEAVIERIPPPADTKGKPLRALVFDSHYDSYKGVVAYVRGGWRYPKNTRLRAMTTGIDLLPVEVGFSHLS